MRREDLKAEFNALVPGRTTEQGASRRAALNVALGAGYAGGGLRTGQVSYQVSGFAGCPQAGLIRRCWAFMADKTVAFH